MSAGTRAEPSARTAPRAEPRAERAERIGAAVRVLPGVAGLTAGPRGYVVTYRPGPPYEGVAVRDGEIEVGVVARAGLPLEEVAESVRRAARPLAGDVPVNVLIGDIAYGGPPG
ncbi:hypothetical protein [Actinomadura rugatobispora]|uniref:Asp23/Gls24 family envelope stress response protein n=1 Tax=Actinomadura rugatobispora TaxID=1994 RepID=A0ABW0ZW81_9ACTN|nr:hypothetical protein GCM10010200_028780 [Actinomadura rugatobispora]